MALRYLALGDSYTIGEGVPEEARWPRQLARALRAEGIPLADPLTIAATGWTTGELDAATDAAAPAGPFDFASLLIRVNNQYRGRAATEYARELAARPGPATGLAACRAARVPARSSPGCGTTPLGAASGRAVAAIARELDACSAAARQACTARGVACVDITPASRARGAEPGMLADDGLHPSVSMYAEWTRLALPVARRLLQPPRTTP